MGVYLTNVHLIGVYFIGGCLMGVYLVGMYLTGVHVIGTFCPNDPPYTHRKVELELSSIILGSDRD
jgi:hypothetical protein